MRDSYGGTPCINPITLYSGSWKIINVQQLNNHISYNKQSHLCFLFLDQPIYLNFTYKSAENYPLDLYYLGDLSGSMENSLSIFKTLGTDLPNNLTTLTENFRLAFGSFMDKPRMPFYMNSLSSGFNLDTSGEAVLFRHKLSFTQDTALFIKTVMLFSSNCKW